MKCLNTSYLCGKLVFKRVSKIFCKLLIIKKCLFLISYYTVFDIILQQISGRIECFILFVRQVLKGKFRIVPKHIYFKIFSKQYPSSCTAIIKFYCRKKIKI